MALALPWLFGIACLYGPSSAGAWAMVAGYGYILGMLGVSLLLRVFAALGFALDFTALAATLGLLTIIAFFCRKRFAKASTDNAGAAPQAFPLWRRILFAALFALLALRFIGLGLELVWRPPLAWDAWTTWSLRAQVWFENRALLPFVDAETWFSAASQSQYTIEAWRYPMTVSLIQLWTALGLGYWDASLSALPWLFCAIALGLGCYGQARLTGNDPLFSLIFAYLLSSLPLLNVHVALAGYADLWMTAVYGMAAMALLRWLHSRNSDYRQGVVALLLVLACPLIKIEGALWSATLLLAWLLAQGSLKRWVALSAVLAIVAGAWLKFGGFALELPGLGLLELRPERLQIPYIGAAELNFQANWRPLLDNLLLLDNWHLLVFVWLAAALAGLSRWRENRLLRIATLILIIDYVWLFLLFFFTDAASWAADYTSLNRLLMPLTPLWVFHLSIVLNALRSARARTRQAFAARSAQYET